MTTIPEIKSITSLPFPNGNTALIGLGVDNKTYFWSFDAGVWVPNWAVGQATAPFVLTKTEKSRRTVGAKKRRG